MAGQETVDIKAAVSALAERGLRRMLAEGGPHLLAHLVEAGLMDELCLTIAPLMAGPGANRIVAGNSQPGTRSTLPLPLTLAHVLEDDGFLLCRYDQERSLTRTNPGLPVHAPHLRNRPTRHTRRPTSDTRIIFFFTPGRGVNTHGRFSRIQGRGSRPRSNPVATAAARSLTPSLA